MNLQILGADKYAIKLKATLQASGKLGFTDTTRNELGLNINSYIYIARDPNTDNLYLIVSETPDVKAFRVHKSGSYYNISTRGLFDELGYDYKAVTYIFDLVRDVSLEEQTHGKTYKMIKREIKRKERKM